MGRPARCSCSSLAALWSAFPWLYLWLSAQIPMPAFQDVLLRAIPEDWQRLSGVPFSEVATHAGRVALAFVDPVVVLAATVLGHHPRQRCRLGPARAGHDGDGARAAGEPRGGVRHAGAGHHRGGGAALRRALRRGVVGGGAGAVGGQGRSLAVRSRRWQRLRAHGLHGRDLGLRVGRRQLPLADDRHHLRLLRVLDPREARGPAERQRSAGSATCRCSTPTSRSGWWGARPESWRLLGRYDGVLLGIGIAAYVRGGRRSSAAAICPLRCNVAWIGSGAAEFAGGRGRVGWHSRPSRPSRGFMAVVRRSVAWHAVVASILVCGPSRHGRRRGRRVAGCRRGTGCRPEPAAVAEPAAGRPARPG